MNRRHSLGLAFFIGFVSLKKAFLVTHQIISQRTARLNVEHTLWAGLAGNRRSLVDKAQCLLRVLVHIDIHQIHIDRRQTLRIALLLHAVDYLPKTTLGTLLITTVPIDMSHHIDSHIHLLVKLALGEFLRQLGCKLIGLEDALTVELEYNLITALGIIGMKVVLLEQIVFQILYSDKETGTVAIVESMVQRIAQCIILCRLIIVWSICSLCRSAQQEKAEKTSKNAFIYSFHLVSNN